MSQTNYTLYSFMRAVRGNWHNALFINCNCQSCSHRGHLPCKGFLMAADADGRPLLMPVETLRRLTGESVEASECRGILDKQAFESAFSQYIEWHTISDEDCSLRQLDTISNNKTPP